MCFMKKIFIFVPAVCLFIICAGSANADAARASWQTVLGNYTSDIGYSPGVFSQGQPEQFDFNLWSGGATPGVPADYEQIWVRILRWDDDDTLLATGIWKQPTGSTTLTYEFAEPGSYTLEASYRDADGNDIAVASSSITIGGGSDLDAGGLLATCAFFITGLIVGALGSFAWRRYRR